MFSFLFSSLLKAAHRVYGETAKRTTLLQKSPSERFDGAEARERRSHGAYPLTAAARKAATPRLRQGGM